MKRLPKKNRFLLVVVIGSLIFPMDVFPLGRSKEERLILECKQTDGFWAWTKGSAKAEGRCVHCPADAGKTCDDNEQCSAHYCLATGCKTFDECKKRAHGTCFNELDVDALQMGVFRKGVYVPTWFDSGRAFTDPPNPPPCPRAKDSEPIPPKPSRSED
jgi:hypothetical protein